MICQDNSRRQVTPDLETFPRWKNTSGAFLEVRKGNAGGRMKRMNE
jgi:hypothetical protein